VWCEGGAEAGQLQRRVDESLVRRAGAQDSAAGAGAAAHPHFSAVAGTLLQLGTVQRWCEARMRGAKQGHVGGGPSRSVQLPQAAPHASQRDAALVVTFGNLIKAS
jgi:hypothetical protein